MAVNSTQTRTRSNARAGRTPATPAAAARRTRPGRVSPTPLRPVPIAGSKPKPSASAAEVVQAYLTGAPGNHGRPVRVLGAFTGVTAEPSEAAEVTLRVPARLFAVFDEEAGQWSWPRGEFTVQVGRSSRDLRLSLTIRSG